jgi:hypothetical protein
MLVVLGERLDRGEPLVARGAQVFVVRHGNSSELKREQGDCRPMSGRVQRRMEELQAKGNGLIHF